MQNRYKKYKIVNHRVPRARAVPSGFKGVIRGIAKWSALGLMALFCFSIMQVVAIRFIDPPLSAYMFWEWIGSEQPVRLPLKWQPLVELSPHLAQAVLAAEDQKFYLHKGFDWDQVKEAWEEAQEGKRLRGASTISMQVARNMFLWPGRSLFRKALEAYYTVLLELLVPKNRILEIYLNIAELGPGIYGAPAASTEYFGRPASRLSAEQAVRLALVLPDPKRRSPLKYSKYMDKRKRVLIKQMQWIKLEDWPRKN
jgi:monofunctional glycosyltransferase